MKTTVDAMATISSEDVLERIKSVVGPKGWTTDAHDIEPHLTEPRGLYRGATPMVVRPASTEEVAAVVKICAAARLPIVPQGGNTGLVGAQVPRESGDSIVVSLARMNRIRAIDPLNYTITVEAGVILADVQKAAEEADRLFPLLHKGQRHDGEDPVDDRLVEVEHPHEFVPSPVEPLKDAPTADVPEGQQPPDHLLGPDPPDDAPQGYGPGVGLGAVVPPRLQTADQSLVDRGRLRLHLPRCEPLEQSPRVHLPPPRLPEILSALPEKVQQVRQESAWLRGGRGSSPGASPLCLCHARARHEISSTAPAESGRVTWAS